MRESVERCKIMLAEREYDYQMHNDVKRCDCQTCKEYRIIERNLSRINDDTPGDQ